MVVLKVLILGALFIVSNNNLNLSHVQERDTFYDMYTSWLGNLYSQGVGLTGYFMKSEWLPRFDEGSVGG